MPVIGDRAVDAVDTHDVLSIIEPLWSAKTETATRVLNRIALVLEWATARKLRTGDNPARWKGGLDAVLPKRENVQKIVPHAARHLPHATYVGLDPHSYAMGTQLDIRNETISQHAASHPEEYHMVCASSMSPIR